MCHGEKEKLTAKKRNSEKNRKVERETGTWTKAAFVSVDNTAWQRRVSSKTLKCGEKDTDDDDGDDDDDDENTACAKCP